MPDLQGSLVPTPCPVCAAPYGFHDEEPHAAAVRRIPAQLMHLTASAKRDLAKAARRADYERYLATQGAGHA